MPKSSCYDYGLKTKGGATVVDFNELERQMSEGEMALFIATAMGMYSAIEAGANQKNLQDRLATHRQNFAVRGQAKAALIMEALMAMVQSTTPK